ARGVACRDRGGACRAPRAGLAADAHGAGGPRYPMVVGCDLGQPRGVACRRTWGERRHSGETQARAHEREGAGLGRHCRSGVSAVRGPYRRDGNGARRRGSRASRRQRVGLMAKVKTPRWGWALTGSGHFFKECLGMIAALDEVDLFVSKAAAEVVRMYRQELEDQKYAPLVHD